MGPVWYEKCSSMIPPMIKFDEMVIFGSIFFPLDNALSLSSFFENIGFGGKGFSVLINNIVSYTPGLGLGRNGFKGRHSW